LNCKGVLSYFAAQNGAEKVIAVEASEMAKHIEKLIKSGKNDWIKNIQVIQCKKINDDIYRKD
jgi:histone-arginine methyltransferase CARM1